MNQKATKKIDKFLKKPNERMITVKGIKFKELKNHNEQNIKCIC